MIHQEDRHCALPTVAASEEHVACLLTKMPLRRFPEGIESDNVSYFYCLARMHLIVGWLCDSRLIERSAMARSKMKELACVALALQLIYSLCYSALHSLNLSPRKAPRPAGQCPSFFARFSKFLLLSIFFLLALLRTVRIGSELDRLLLPSSPVPCSTSSSPQSLVAAMGGGGGSGEARLVGPGEFWLQPDGMGYRPCLRFSEQYGAESEEARRSPRRKYLLVVVSGGLNQQRNQIVDAVVIARILRAALVVPILQVNVIWGDESEFNDIFDLEHFKKVLSDDVKVVSSLPSTHIRMRPGVENQLPLHASPQLIEKRYLKRLNRDGVLLLRGLDSRLSKDLPPDLQKLRCKVAFHALRFAAPIQEFGDKLASRMSSKGPYLALHLRLEKDVWVRTGCLPGLSPEYDEIIRRERKLRPKLLTGRSNMTSHERKLAGFCPLNALEITRLLKALGTPRDAMIYWAGGRPLGGAEALRPLTTTFPNVYNKESISSPGELRPFASRASVLAAVDYIVCEQSDVFMPSHGGNMGHLMQGHRAFSGHRKFITPNKRQMLPFFLDASLPEPEFERIVKELHWGSMGQPEWRTGKAGKDVTAYPIPECMCNGTSAEVRR